MGQWVFNDATEKQSLNEQECVSRIENAIKPLKGIKCSLKSKTYLINTKIISQIIFLSSANYLSKKSLKQIDELIFDFAWDNKPPKIKKSSIIAPLNFGGVKLPLFSVKYRALRIFWIKECLNDNNHIWKCFNSDLYGIDY